MGGTSSVTRFALRGSPGDFDEWEALGNPGWSFDEVLPFFIKLESDAEFRDRSWHGDRGPIPVSRYLNDDLTEVGTAAMEAMQAMGFPAVEDHNQPGAVGVGRIPMNSVDGVRVTTASAYLPADRTPPNITIIADTQIADLLFEGNRVVGVRGLDGAGFRAPHVVLCAGTYGSPAILMRSGIGPADHLRSLGIDVRVDLPGVGSNLADHAALDVDCGFTGAVRETPWLHTIATFRSSSAAVTGPPDLMFWVPDPFSPDGSTPVFEIEVALLKPKSRGTVRLRSADPVEPPRITLPSLNDSTDIDVLSEGYRLGVELANRPEIRRLCSLPSSPSVEDAEFGRFARENAYSIPHVVGTCAMGPIPEHGGVVDSSGRVYGTEGLFVVDASIMPTVPSGFTHLPTIMIAERLSEQMDTLRV
jgi:choline dehydrogenase